MNQDLDTNKILILELNNFEPADNNSTLSMLTVTQPFLQTDRQMDRQMFHTKNNYYFTVPLSITMLHQQINTRLCLLIFASFNRAYNISFYGQTLYNNSPFFTPVYISL